MDIPFVQPRLRYLPITVQININKSRQTCCIMTLLLITYTYIQMDIAMRRIPDSIFHALRDKPKTHRTMNIGPSERVFWTDYLDHWY